MTDKFLDTNILIRFVIGDVPDLVEYVDILFEKANVENLIYFVIPEVLVEFRYVLSTHYNFEKADIIETLEGILDLGFIKIFDNKNLDFGEVLQIYKKHSTLSFEDCIYLQTCLQGGLELLTFDQKLEKVFKKSINL